MKHLLLMLMMALVMPVAMSAQEPTIYRSVEQMPQFPGGEAALMKYIQSHVNYPEGTDVEGRVILQFVVETDGSIGEVKVVRSVDEALDKEAVRLIESLPKFTPGRQNGEAVAVWYTLPVSFKRDGGSPSYPGLFDGYRQYAPSDSTIYRSVEQMPQFPGGEAALMKYIQSHVNYPEGTDVEGRVILQFVVKTDGSIGEVKVVRSVDEALDKEAVRLIKSLPNFTPGRQNGQAVSVWYTLPVTFKPREGSQRYRSDEYDTSHQNASSDTTIYRSVEVEQMPQFPGGEAALEEYIQSHLQYPEGTDNQGIVVVQFVVKADGSIGEVKVFLRADEALNEEAVRVVKSLPKFTPGRQNGQAVSVWYTFHVSFRR